MLATPSLCVDMITKVKEHGFKVTTMQYVSFGGAPCSKQLVLELQEAINVQHLIVSIR